MTGRESAFSKPSFLRTSVLTIAGIAILFSIDTFLASKERSESRVEGQRLYDAGQRLMQQGLSVDAENQFRAALSVARDNQQYQLALARALTAAGRLSDAEANLADLLQRDGTGGEPNLAMARVLTKEGRIPEAISYYHRAIYGQWKQNALANRMQARIELIDLLVSRNEKAGLLAELLPLQEEAPDDVKTKMELGRLFIAAGSPARGATVFRDVLREKPQDPDAHDGLGEAEFATGNYRTAAAQFQTVLRFRPDDNNARQRVEICNQVLTLDPAQRGLSVEERYRRSRKLLDLTLNDARPCVSSNASRDLIDTAEKALKQRVPASRQGPAYESNLDLSDQLWQARKTECGASAVPANEPLSLVLNRLAQ